jgi:hypothetical protein
MDTDMQSIWDALASTVSIAGLLGLLVLGWVFALVGSTIREGHIQHRRFRDSEAGSQDEGNDFTVDSK